MTGILIGALRVCRVPTLDGDVEINMKPGTQHGDTLRMSGKGIRMDLAGGSGRRGDQLIHISVQLPRNLSARQRELLEEFRREEEQRKRQAA